MVIGWLLQAVQIHESSEKLLLSAGCAFTGVKLPQWILPQLVNGGSAGN